MDNQSFKLGMVGLGVMGRNFALNIADSGYPVVGLDNSNDKVAQFDREADDQPVQGTSSAKDFVAALEKPRNVMMLVPAGNAVDSVINEMIPLLEEGDLIIDGGNSHYTDTYRRYQKLEKKGINFLGVGVSGGEEGARFGPSIMAGGSQDAYKRVQDMFEAAAAKKDDDPCVAWLGPNSAGHYVKMVHNGIEYGLMQLIAECYNIMKTGLDFNNNQLHEVFDDWNSSKLSSFLIDITADIFAQPDDKSDGHLIDHILDSAKQKGTGKWTSQDAMDLKVPTPNIDMAVAMRDISAYKKERVAADKKLKGPDTKIKVDDDTFVEQLKEAFYFSMIVTYAQGMSQLQAASNEYDYNLNYEKVAKIWRSGCIIRAELLEDIRAAYDKKPDLSNLAVDDHFASELIQEQSHLRTVVEHAAKAGIPAPSMMAALGYYDSYRNAWLPANLIQAQRDNFGSHTYERTDTEGTFHTSWNSED